MRYRIRMEFLFQGLRIFKGRCKDIFWNIAYDILYEREWIGVVLMFQGLKTFQESYKDTFKIMHVPYPHVKKH